MKAVLYLEDGTLFRGFSFGAEGEVIGEVVFNTSMTGYQEILTDPSYYGQIVTMTYTQIGNYGVNEEDVESSNVHVSGFIVREFFDNYSNFRAKASISSYLKKNRITGISEIDTRMLTRRIRSAGAMKGIISTETDDISILADKLKNHPDMVGSDLVKYVTCKSGYIYRAGSNSKSASPAHNSADSPSYRLIDNPSDNPSDVTKYNSIDNTVENKIHNNIYNGLSNNICNPVFTIAALDFGIKFNILKCLDMAGFKIHVLPADTSVKNILALKPDGIFLSNGPGDPSAVGYAVSSIAEMLGQIPIFGICLGHQLMALALGAKTYKLKFGHHGGNHPVKNLENDRVEITTQNHGFAVDPDSLSLINKSSFKITHMNLNDNTIEGIEYPEIFAYSVQHHPEAGPGPYDSRYIFKNFRRYIEEFKKQQIK